MGTRGCPVDRKHALASGTFQAQQKNTTVSRLDRAVKSLPAEARTDRDNPPTLAARATAGILRVTASEGWWRRRDSDCQSHSGSTTYRNTRRIDSVDPIKRSRTGARKRSSKASVCWANQSMPAESARSSSLFPPGDYRRLGRTAAAKQMKNSTFRNSPSDRKAIGARHCVHRRGRVLSWRVGEKGRSSSICARDDLPVRFTANPLRGLGL